MNNKGFMMAEVVVVSAIILVTLVGLYVSYNKIISAYNQRVNYYDITTLYELANIRDNTNLSGLSSKSIVINETYKKVYYLNYNDLIELTEVVNNQTFKDYLQYISGAVSFNTEYPTENILVMERCINDIDNCKYAYLEVFDEEISE